MLVVVGGWSMISHHSGGVPVVQADSGPMRVKPANPGGLQVAGAGNEIFSGGSDTDVEKLAPPPETPDPQALRAPPPPPAAAAPALPPPRPARPGGCAGRRAIPPPPQRLRRGHRNRRIGGCRTPEPTPAVPPLPRAPAVAAAALPSAAAAASAVRSAERPVAAGSAAEHGKAQVQLAALSSEQAARAEWERMVKRWPALFGGHQPAFSKIERGGQVFWRVRTGGFEGVAQATVFCEHLRARAAGARWRISDRSVGQGVRLGARLCRVIAFAEVRLRGPARGLCESFCRKHLTRRARRATKQDGEAFPARRWSQRPGISR